MEAHFLIRIETVRTALSTSLGTDRTLWNCGKEQATISGPNLGTQKGKAGGLLGQG